MIVNLTPMPNRLVLQSFNENGDGMVADASSGAVVAIISTTGNNGRSFVQMLLDRWNAQEKSAPPPRHVIGYSQSINQWGDTSGVHHIMVRRGDAAPAPACGRRAHTWGVVHDEAPAHVCSACVSKASTSA
jgi:hypothetical protein